MSIKAGWWDSSLAIWDFSRNNKYCIELSTANAIYLSRSVIAISDFRSSHSELFCKKGILETFSKFTSISSATEVFCEFCKILKKTFFFVKHLQWLHLAFAPIRISYSNTVCNKSAAEAWISEYFMVEQKTSFSPVFS